jgi:hypothetical protein
LIFILPSKSYTHLRWSITIQYNITIHLLQILLKVLYLVNVLNSTIHYKTLYFSPDSPSKSYTLLYSSNTKNYTTPNRLRFSLKVLYSRTTLPISIKNSTITMRLRFSSKSYTSLTQSEYMTRSNSLISPDSPSKSYTLFNPHSESHQYTQSSSSPDSLSKSYTWVVTVITNLTNNSINWVSDSPQSPILWVTLIQHSTYQDITK